MAEASNGPAEPAVNKFQSKFGERTDGQTECFTRRPEGMGTWAEQIGHNKLIIYMQSLRTRVFIRNMPDGAVGTVKYYAKGSAISLWYMKIVILI